MTIRWGIKARVLFLALIPATTLSILLSAYFIHSRLDDLNRELDNKGIAMASSLSSQASIDLFYGNIENLSNIARKNLSDEATNISFYTYIGEELSSEGKLSEEFLTENLNNDNITIIRNQKNDSLFFINPIVLSQVIIDDLNIEVHSKHLQQEAIIGWVRVEIDRKVTKIREFLLLAHNALIIFFSLSVSGLIALRLGYNVTEPILSLTSAIEKIKEGKLDTRVNTTCKWELAILESGINTMADSLQQAHQEMQDNIENATAELRYTLKQIEIQNEALEISHKEAKQANKLKSEFLASMSHELRTPLNGIIGFINLLQKTDLSLRQADFLLTIQKSAQSLLSIINDILDFSKIEAGKLHLDITPMDLRDCIEEALTLMAPSAHEKNLELIPFFAKDIPLKIMADPLRLKQLIINLVSNSIKFTEHGNIIIRISLKSQPSPNQGIFTVSVTDTGMGLTTQQQQELFDAFNQTNPNITRRFGGTGLGLVICKKLVAQMHGDITISSKKNHGATFSFTFTASILDNKPNSSFSKIADKPVLVYDPHPVAQQSLMQLFDFWGITSSAVLSMQNIYATLDAAYQRKQPFTFVIIGLNNPSDSFALNAIKKIVSQINSSKLSCYVGILTNTTDLLLHNEIIKTGVNFCLVKPISQRKILQSLQDIIQCPKNNQHYPMKLIKPSTINILAVDDNPANLKLVKAFLDNLGVNTSIASSGPQAIEQSKQIKFDLIIMDLHMPNMDGIETTNKIRGSCPNNSNTPIIALSAHIILDSEQQNNNINEYLIKPIDENNLKACVYKWTQNGMAQTIAIKQDPIIDWSKCLELAANKTALAKEMLAMFIEQIPDTLTTLNSALKNHSWQEMCEIIHKFHGGCCYVGITKLKKCSAELEQSLNGKSIDIDYIAEKTHNFNDLCQQSLEYYRTHEFQQQMELAV